jgi:hypothetical protein
MGAARRLSGELMRVLFATCALLVATPAAASDASTAAAASYVIDTTASTTALEVGDDGRFVLEIQPRPGVHVQRQAPLRAKLGATPGIALAKTGLGRGDLVDPAVDAPRFEVAFTATSAGRHEVRANLQFFVCSATWCVRQERDVVLAVEVR